MQLSGLPLLPITILFYIFILYLHVKLKRQLIIISLLFLYTFFLIESSFHLLVFIISIIIGYITDFYGVRKNLWKYPTKSGYSLWVGIGWGTLILSIWKMSTIPIQISSFLVLTVFLVEYFYGTLKIYSKPILFIRYFSILILVFHYPNLFFLSFFFGMFNELLAVHKFQAWKYSEKYSFILFGFGYAMVSILTIIVTQFVLNYRIPDLLEIIIFSLIFTSYIFESIMNKVKFEDYRTSFNSIRGK